MDKTNFRIAEQLEQDWIRANWILSLTIKIRLGIYRDIK